MDNLPKHLRISTLNPSNDDVNARRASIDKLSAAWGKIKQVDDILNKAQQIADSLGGNGEPHKDLGMEVQAAMQEHASAFLYEESPLDVGICAGMAALSVLSRPQDGNDWTIADVYSNALWSALAFQPPLAEEKRERLRRDVLASALARSQTSAIRVRERIAVPDLPELTVTTTAAGETTTNFKTAAGATIEALRCNAALDREELEFLWWVQLNRSRLLKRPIPTMAEPLRLVASGIEAATHLRRLPADVHYDLVCRTLDEDPELDLRELIEVVGGHRTALAKSFNATRAAAYPKIFPLLHALSTGHASVPGTDEKRRASTWAGMALLEAGLNRMCDKGTIAL